MLFYKIQGMELEQCMNSSVCLPNKPRVVVGLNGATANFFVDNAAYREFLYTTFNVSSLDMESAAIVMVRSSNNNYVERISASKKQLIDSSNSFLSDITTKK